VYLEKWGWKGTVDNFLKYWFEGERETDQRILDLVQTLRAQGAKVYLASDNEKNRAKYIMEEVGLGEKFDGGFFSSHLGVTKSEPAFFEHIAQELGVQPSQLEYWDDDPKNVEVAKQVGVQANVYEDFDSFKESVLK
jgi:putative hydrolase of the HAD superfamily